MYREKRYKQIVHFIEDEIRSSNLKMGDKVPSLKSLIIKFGLSRSSTLLAMRELESRGLVEAAPSIGYFVTGTKPEVTERILLLFNEFNSFKEDLYNSFVEAMGNNSVIDIMFHNYDRRVFETLLEQANGKYTSFVLMPGKMTGLGTFLSQLKGRVILADHLAPDIMGMFPSVAQNFAEDTFNALVSAEDIICHYDIITLVQSAHKEPEERYDGIQTFCAKRGIGHLYIPTMKGRQVLKGVLYITPDDREIVNILKDAEAQGLTVGKDFGLMSYNDTPLKEVLSGGIATITTDFSQMGRTLADLVRNYRICTLHNPCRLILRKSI